MINIGGNKSSLNQIVVARSWAGCARTRFDDDDDVGDDDDGDEDEDEDDDGYFVTPA